MEGTQWVPCQISLSYPLCSHTLGDSQIQRSRVNWSKLQGWSVTTERAKTWLGSPVTDPGNDTTNKKGLGLVWVVRWL